jgi:hypothetical protein
MQFGKLQRADGRTAVVAVEGGGAFPIDLTRDPAVRCLADLLHAADPVRTAAGLRAGRAARRPGVARTSRSSRGMGGGRDVQAE